MPIRRPLQHRPTHSRPSEAGLRHVRSFRQRLTLLSLIPALSKDNFRFGNAKLVINYGLNKVRFLAAVPVDSRVRVRSELVDVAKVDDSTANVTVRHTIEIDGVDKPAAVAEMIARAIF